MYIKLTENDNYYKLNNNRYLIDTYHSIERFENDERFNDKANTDEFKQEIINIANKVSKEIITRYNDKSQIYGVHSKSTGLGMIIDWRTDYKVKNKDNNAILVTILPVKRFHSFKSDTLPLIVEHLLKKYYSIMEESEINNKPGFCDHHLNESRDLKIVFYEGSLHDTNIDEWIFIE